MTKPEFPRPPKKDAMHAQAVFRLPQEALLRADALIPKVKVAANSPLASLLVGSINRSYILRLAVTLGLEKLEAMVETETKAP